MKETKEFPEEESRMVGLLTGLAIALGILVHRVFFLVALVVALGGWIERILQRIHGQKENGPRVATS